MDNESNPLVAFDDVEVADQRQRIHNEFKFISDVPDFTVEDIKEIRHRLSLSQEMLAKILGVAKRTAEAWETGRKVPNGSTRRLLQILKADTDAIRRSGIAEW